MALPNSNISTSLVKSTLGAATNDVGALCTHTNVNKWSKRKPVIQPLITTDGNPSWWRATNGNCGLIIPTFSSISALMTYVDANGSDWGYAKPTGGAASPYRLGDFRQYEHAAQSPMSVNTPAPIYFQGTVSAPMSMNLRVQSAYELTMADIGNAVNLGNMYFGVAVYQGGSNKNITESQAITVADGGGVDLPISTWSDGTYTVYMFAGTVSKPTYSSSESGVYVPIPYGKFTITILNTYAIQLAVFGDITLGDKNVLNWTVHFINNKTVPESVSGITIGWRYGDNVITDPLEMGESSTTITSMSANGESYQTITGSQMGALPQFDLRGGYMYLQCTSNPELNVNRQDIGMEN